MDASTANGVDVQSWEKGISAIALFVEDLAVAKQFYLETFGLPLLFEDDDAAMFKFGATYIKLLKNGEAGELYAPATVGSHAAGSRVVLTLPVDDVDVRSAELVARGVELLNGPIDRPWGIRTACFRDPDGHIWEIAK